MDKKTCLKEHLPQFEKELSSSPLLNVDFEKNGVLEIIPSSLTDFFDFFELGREFEFTTFFDRSFSSPDKKVNFGSERIIRKDRYSRSELDDKIDYKKLQPDKLITCSLPLIQDRALAFLENKDNIYLTFGTMFYKKKGEKTISTSPLVFFKVRVRRANNTFYLSMDTNSPIYNLPLFISLDKDYRIKFSIDMTDFDSEKLIEEVNSKCGKYSFASDRSINLLGIDINKDINLADIVSYIPKMDSDSIFMDSKSRGASFVSKEPHPLFVHQGLNEISDNDISYVNADKDLSSFFVKDTIEETILHKQNVLVVASDSKQKEKLIQELTGEYYDAFMCFDDISAPGSGLFTSIEKASNKPGYLIDSAVLMEKENLKAIEQKSRDLDGKLNISIPSTDESDLDFYRNYCRYQMGAKQKFTFKGEDYTYEDFLSDKDFLAFLQASDEFLTKPFTKHPFYGLNSTIKVEQYDDIISFLKSMVEDIRKFSSAIDKSMVKLSSWSDFNSLKDYDDSNKLFTIFSKYDGFPIEYFNIDFTSELLDDINNLVNYFRLEASIRLSIDVLCRPEIWNMDFEQILLSVEVKKKERELLKKMKGIIKILPLKKNFRTLIVLIDKFQDNREKIKELIPQMTKIFGPNGGTLDGLLSILQAHEFISSYKRHKKIYDYLNFDNIFTENIFNNKEFSDKYRAEYYPNLVELRSVLEHDFDKYRKIFDEDKTDYFALSFTDVEKVLSKRIGASKDSFLSYLDFSYRVDKGSNLLREALLEVEKEEKDLTGFTDSYLCSLYEYLMLASIKDADSLNLLKEFSSNLFEFYREDKEERFISRLDAVASFLNNRQAVLAKPSYQQTIKNLKAMYHMRRMLSLSQSLRIGGDAFFHLYPLSIISADELSNYVNYKFDLVILFDSGEDFYKDLFASMISAKKIVALGSTSRPCFHQINFSLESDFRPYTNISFYPSSFYSAVKAAYLRQGISLIQNKVINSSVVVPYYFEKGEERFALRLNDISKLSYEESYIFPSLLYHLYNIKTVYLYTIPFIVFSDLSVMSTYRDVKSIISQLMKSDNQYDKMTYSQKRRAEYFLTLDKISSSFRPFDKPDEETRTLENSPLRESTKEVRSILSISYLEIASGILVYLSYFTYLDEETLLKQISKVIGTDIMDVDYRLLFGKAEKYLLDEKKIVKNGYRLSLVR